MIKQTKYLFTMFPVYQKTIEVIVIGFFIAKRLTPTFLTLIFSIKIW
ncbi:hypothetical protein KKE19_01940 [Patescibacteria group bacterium]|nr:hypothetical protein [Patescibacteria group bacterium]MBU4274554.1 hypothetical protein [Patescibacteria group bacterium]MBU4367459.1 hypothetical protein [Patescibacteria group bacterium]MBU4461779.1 hypothetical protein [Patescibacteria group bacterium]MCG2700163.1 hypothetical protein [Candidatus Parcubacteria bacterium]